ncbi:hypothetical protein [uncultured Brevundimonas sp.]|uniref:hypothetical protein n=1 Tax=uncultured Brevundimonas sp. TaxID=213418 RepID=UPI0030EB1BF9|tara:strand:+ start:1941 stop:2153 length:213 start_codon:yes stop_codon:yes gene_type:complete
MRRSERVFSATERRVAVVALVLTVLVTVLGLTVGQSWSPPSLGPYGTDAYAVAASPGILDARPIMSTPNS